MNKNIKTGTTLYLYTINYRVSVKTYKVVGETPTLWKLSRGAKCRKKDLYLVGDNYKRLQVERDSHYDKKILGQDTIDNLKEKLDDILTKIHKGSITYQEAKKYLNVLDKGNNNE